MHEVREAALRREIENAQRACHAKPLALRRVYAFAIIHQQEIGVERDRQLNCRFLASVNSF